jgi:signal transduction histidine kinase/ActR/RegA family two-component response regulator
VSPRVVACVLVLSWIPAQGVRGDDALTNAQEVRSLSGKELAAGPRVRLIGVVTQTHPDGQGFWLQDATAGVHVLPGRDTPALQQGDQVELEGSAEAGEFAPRVRAQQVRRAGRGDLPCPQHFNFSIGQSRWLDAQWVQAHVVVRDAHAKSGTTRIEVFTPHGCGTLVLAGEERLPAARALRDAFLVVRGVCVPRVKGREVAGPPQVYISALPEPASPAADATGGAEAVSRVIGLLREFIPAPHPGLRKVKIVGVVTARPLPGLVVVQDHTGGVIVVPDDPNTDAPLGARVEVCGMLRTEDQHVSVTRASVRVGPPVALPEPVAARPHELAAGLHHARLVKVSGRVEALRSVGDWTIVTLFDGAHRFEAYVSGELHRPEMTRLVGSKIEVAGVPLGTGPDGTPATVPGLFLRGADAVTILEPPQATNGGSWWTATRVAYFFGGFLAVAVVGGAWAWTLRVRVRQAAREIERHYEEKAKLEQQLRQAAKLEAVGRLAGGIAHDFNNLLTVINGCAELLAEDPAGDPQRLADLTEDIRRAGDRAAALTGQLLTFSRKRDVKISPVNLNEVVADTARLLNRVIGEHIRIETAVVPELPLVRAEPGLLHQVIMNLAVNARDAMPHGGTLTLTTALVLDPGEPLASAEGPIGSAPRKYVRLTVSDTGIGMSEEVKARVFEPFFTTKEINKGTGLGLATVYGVVQSLSGKIRVDSEPGRGTTFQIDLRIHGDPISDAELALPSTPLPGARLTLPARLAGTTVLVVEDNEMVRDLLVTGLAADGATVLAADRPDEALRLLAQRTGGVDVLVTDVVMPGMSGRELADRVRADRPGIRIIFMSGYTADEVLRQGVLEDQVEFIQKPFTPDHLTTRLLRVLGRTPSDHIRGA